MARTLRRPMFRIGGMAHEQRTGYMGGGMTGIMSGITPRQPDAGLTPRMGLQQGSVPSIEDIIAAQELKDPSTIIYDEDYIGKQADKYKRKLYNTSGQLAYGQQMKTPKSPTERAIMEYFETQPEAALETFKKGKLFGSDINYSKLQADQAKKAAAAGIDLGFPKQTIDDKKIVNNTDIDGKGGAGSGQSDLENLQDYMKMFEAAAAGDPDDARKSKYLELAKFGANLIAQPGGDLVGSIGKAASSSIGGLSKQMADEAATKKSAKLMGLKAGLDKTDMGEFGKKIKALAKFSGRSEEDVAKKFLSGDDDFDKIYLEGAEQAGVEAGRSQINYLSNIKKMASKNPDIAAELNKPFPKKNPVEGEYYVFPNGKFTRYVGGEKLTPQDPGFYDKED